MADDSQVVLVDTLNEQVFGPFKSKDEAKVYLVDNEWGEQGWFISDLYPPPPDPITWLDQASLATSEAKAVTEATLARFYKWLPGNEGLEDELIEDVVKEFTKAYGATHQSDGG
jgi:hypothetical protein